MTAQMIWTQMINDLTPGDWRYLKPNPSGDTVPGGAHAYSILYAWCRDNDITLREGVEALVDGGFGLWDSATELTHWVEIAAGTSTVNREAVEQRSDPYCVRLDIDGSNSSALVAQGKPLDASTPCVFYIWHKGTGGATARIQIQDDTTNLYLQADGSWGALYSFPITTTTSWTQFNKPFTTVGANNYVFTAQRLSATSKSLYFDDASVLQGKIPALSPVIP